VIQVLAGLEVSMDGSTELSDAVWERVGPICRQASDPGRTGRDNRLFVRSGAVAGAIGCALAVLRWSSANGTASTSASPLVPEGVWGRLFNALADTPGLGLTCW